MRPSMPIIAKGAATAVVLGGIWSELGPKLAALAAVLTALAAVYKEVGRPTVKMIKHAGDVYENLTTMDSRVSRQIAEIKAGQEALTGQVDRLANNARLREDEIERTVTTVRTDLERRIDKLEVGFEVVRSFVGTRSSDHRDATQ